MGELFGLFDTTGFPARWHCGRWSPLLGWVHIASDMAIFAAYMAIPIALMFFINQRRDLPKPFPILFWLFGAFIVACGLTHLIEAVIFWQPVYRLAGVVKAATASVSWMTLAFLVPAVPKALALKSPNQLERQIAEATAQLQRERDAAAYLAAIVESSQDAIIGHDLSGRIQSWNRGAARMFGHSLEEIEGVSCDVLVPKEQHQELADALARARRGEVVDQLETEWVRKDRSPIAVDVAISPLLNRDGNLSGLSMIVRDISARRAGETLLRAKTVELERSNEELEQFAYVASHDLQEPLRMVVSFMDLFKRNYGTGLDATATQYIEFAVDGATRMKQLVDALLLYSRVDGRGGRFEKVPLEVTLSNVVKGLPHLIEESGARITCEELPVVWGDSSQLEQVFQNLLANAIKFRAERPPEIKVSCRSHAAHWEISVQDNGIGFPPQHAERIFQMFQRLHGRTTYAGSGIGLAIAKRIIGRHGGKVWATGEPNRGATFHFTLPMQPAVNSERRHDQALQ